ncbi:GPP34 family phosphoprotein [Amycolatopsis rhabdoformis]|uniref:GPP34 family phosphoprotein n=1 Tax=Amycolatopsis rhabdoformis TaxID=1448059 RepID=A0ABZ1ILT7_9PSEU|nr:GPP34 family phosphoprotein [Amycolatopsis rhabdoformis]WSE34450.1 GPP34 family phosphoprotein [Amycolatopsis rhabdoformis]
MGHDLAAGEAAMTLSLAARAYLLGCDSDGGRVRRRGDAALFVRAAALTDLLLRGRLRVAGGRVSASGAGPTGDLLLDDVLAGLADEGPTRWKRLLRQGSADTLHSLEQQLVAAGVLHSRVTPLWRRTVVRLAERAPADAVRATVDNALTAPLSEVDARAAALTALAAATRIGFTRRSARRHADRLRALDEVAGSVVPEVRAVVRGLRRRRTALIASSS